MLGIVGTQIDFISAYFYARAPSKVDNAILLAKSSDEIPALATKQRQVVNAHYGAHAPGVEMMITETDSVYQNPGTQTLGVVKAMFLVENYLN